jgi:predicted O-linked N-acetylglucosamine transferase (SPINDLY family)
MRARFPDFAEPPQVPPKREKLRIGIATSFFTRHSNWKSKSKGWIENLNRRDFALYGYHLGRKSDDVTVLAERSFEHFVKGERSIEDWAKRIRGDRLNVLIFPEIGMDAMTLKLASLRLAPVQASSWGHPNTSGLPTIDYFLSSELMEGPEGDEYYSERVVRLPNLSINYTPPLHGAERLRREDIGLEASSVMYWCCQSLYKYLAQYDDVFARIATRVSQAKFVFIAHPHAQAATRLFRDRLEQALSRHRLAASDHCIFLPHMPYDRFCAVAREADIFLDSVGWSGCNSTLECMSFDTPIVTLPLASMRSRHTAAILTMMGATEMIAESLNDYVALASRLGLDAALRRRLSDKIAATKHKVMGDVECVRGLERFLREVAGVWPLGAE